MKPEASLLTSSQADILNGLRHLKNLSMVLQEPPLLAFLDGGEDGVSRLRQKEKKC